MWCSARGSQCALTVTREWWQVAAGTGCREREACHVHLLRARALRLAPTLMVIDCQRVSGCAALRRDRLACVLSRRRKQRRAAP